MPEPMDIDTEIPRKSIGAPDRKSRGKLREASLGSTSIAPRTPKTTVKQDIGTQTRRILRVKKDGENKGGTASAYKSTPPSEKMLKRKLFDSPGDEPLSPVLGGNRTKLRRIMESSPARLRRSSATGAVRKSRVSRASGRPSAAPPVRKSGACPIGLETMTVRQLTNLLVSAGVDTSDCLEKQELIDRANEHGLANPVGAGGGRQSVSAKSTPVLEAAPIPVPSLGNVKRHSRKHSGGKVSQTALMEIARIEEVCSKSGSNCFDILGMSRSGATEASIKTRSKQLFRYVHPDKIQDEEVKRRAHNVFQLINQAVDDANKLVSSSVAKDPPRPPMGIKYTVERASTVVLLHWKPDKTADCFRVFASLMGRTPIDQGTLANLTGDNGELEYAISAQSRAGNDDLFRRGKFEVSISAINSAGESPPMSITVDLSRPNSLGGLKRHHTIC